MPAASWFQRRTGVELGSLSAVADSKQTLLCTYMSAALLVGLIAQSVLGWWWADPVAALVIAGLAVREGVNTWRGQACSHQPRCCLGRTASKVRTLRGGLRLLLTSPPVGRIDAYEPVVPSVFLRERLDAISVD